MTVSTFLHTHCLNQHDFILELGDVVLLSVIMKCFSQKTQFLPCYIDLAGWCWRGVPHPQHCGRCPPLSPRDWGRPDPALPSWPAAVSWSSWLLTLDTCAAAATIISSLFTHSGQKVFYRRPHSFCVKISQKWRLHHLSFHQGSAQCQSLFMF